LKLSPVLLVGSFCVALVLSLMGFMAPAAMLGDIIGDWQLSNAQAGWLGGALFAGYILTVPVLTAYTDRIDPKRIYLVCAALGAIGNFGFGFVADGLWSGVVFRVLTGIGLAGTFMPGLKALSDQLPAGRTQQRGATYYTSVFALGSGLSILIAGGAANLLDWHWAFAIAGAGGLGAFLIVAVVLPANPPDPDARPPGAALDFRPVLKDRAVMSYVMSSLGVAWEVFASRVWFVTFFLYLQTQFPGAESGWSPVVWATIVALVGVPAAMLIGEMSVRYNRHRILIGVAVVSVALAVSIGFTVDAAYEIPLVLSILFGMFSYGRTAATTAGTVAVADPKRRGGALAIQSFVGFSGGILGPLAFGIALDAAGGSGTAAAWVIAMMVMAVGPVITILALLAMPKHRRTT
jgi:MFS family permease